MSITVNFLINNLDIFFIKESSFRTYYFLETLKNVSNPKKKKKKQPKYVNIENKF